MEGYSRIADSELLLHKPTVALTGAGTTGGTVLAALKTHVTGPGCFAPGTELVVNVAEAEDGDADETYTIAFEGQKDGGGYVNLGTWNIPRGTVGVLHIPVRNADFTDIMDEIRVLFVLGGTTPTLDCVVRLTTTRI